MHLSLAQVLFYIITNKNTNQVFFENIFVKALFVFTLQLDHFSSIIIRKYTRGILT